MAAQVDSGRPYSSRSLLLGSMLSSRPQPPTPEVQDHILRLDGQFGLEGKGITVENKAIHSGNNGAVYKAIDADGKHCVVKALFNCTSATGVIKERMLSAAIRERDNMRCFGLNSDVIYDPSMKSIYITMPYYNGKTARSIVTNDSSELQSALHDGRTLDAANAFRKLLQLLQQSLDELGNFHSVTGLVHGDSWLDNFIVTNERDHRVRLIDFGGCCSNGSTHLEYCSHIKRLGAGSYHTAPEVPCIANSTHASKNIPKKIKALNKKLKLLKNTNTDNINAEKIKKLQDTLSQLEDHGNVYTSYQEYSAKVSYSADIHSLAASFIYDGMLEIMDEIPDNWRTVIKRDNIQSSVLNFCKWLLVNACNSDWFYNSLISDAQINEDFISACREERDSRLALKRGSRQLSSEGRLSTNELSAVLSRRIARLEHISGTALKDTALPSVEKLITQWESRSNKTPKNS